MGVSAFLAVLAVALFFSPNGGSSSSPSSVGPLCSARSCPVAFCGQPSPRNGLGPMVWTGKFSTKPISRVISKLPVDLVGPQPVLIVAPANYS